MIELLLDTNVYRGDPKRKSAGFQVLAKLCAGKQVNLHMPSVVKGEFESHLQAEYSEPLKVALSNVKTASKAFGSHFATPPDTVVAQLSDSVQQAEAWIMDEFSAWCAQLQVAFSTVADHHGKNVMDAYFLGQPPFGTKKERNDIPDAFIFEAIKDVAAAVDELHVITDDKRLKKAVAALSNVTLWPSLDKFVLDELCQDALDEVNSAGLIAALKSNEELMLEFARPHLFDELLSYEFTSESIPDDNNEATIGQLDIPDEIDINWDEVEDYGDGVIAVPFTFEMDIHAEFSLYKSDYYSLGEDLYDQISISEGNSHYFDAELEMSVNVTGRLAVTLNTKRFDGTPDSVARQLDAQSVNVSEIEDVS